MSRASPVFGRSTKSRCHTGTSTFREWKVFRMDVSEKENAIRAVEGAVEVYNLAADMGGMGFIERFRIECLRSILINTHMIEAAYRAGCQAVFLLLLCLRLQHHASARPACPCPEGVGCLPGHG